MNPKTIALAGGLFAVMTFIHFAVDWIFQTHSEAMQKHNNPRIRAKHCLIYTAPFLPLLWWLGCGRWEIVLSAVVLFGSHFIEDTYLPVYWWAKYVRRPPELLYRIVVTASGTMVQLPSGETFPLTGKLEEVTSILQKAFTVSTRVWPVGAPLWVKEIATQCHEGRLTVAGANEVLLRKGFLEFISGPLGKILMIAIDQIIHLAFLWVPVYFVMRHM
jgi:hypothetical protein